jgi:hypothetical protein
MPPKFDSSPVVAFFKDQETAQQCLRQLRSSGFKNEQIGVSYPKDSVLSPANDPGVYRTVDQENSKSDIQDFEHLDDELAHGMPAQPTPNTRQFDPEGQAVGYEFPVQGVVVSVSAEPNQREQAREVLHHFGARLADWKPDVA